MSGRIPGRAARLAVAILAATALSAVAAWAASASEVIYNNIPSPFPGNVVSQAFEATSTSEFGGQVEFAATARKNPVVTVVMSSWACETGNWYEHTCVTTPGAKFEWPVTFSIYEAGPGNAVGQKIAAGSKVFKMPYRPSGSPKCTGEYAGGWYGMGRCWHGKAFKISLPLKVAKLPAKAIISVAYDTSDYGTTPQRPQPCNSTSAGCPYDSLNVGLREASEPGTQVGGNLAGDAYISSTWTGAYCDGGAGGTGFFRLDVPQLGGCVAGYDGIVGEPYQPAISVRASE